MGLLQRLGARLLGEGDLVVQNTGEVTESDGGVAVTGYSGPPPRKRQSVTVRNTGDATATGSGSQATSGIDWS